MHPLYDEDSSNYRWPSDSHLGLFARILHTQLVRDHDGAPNVEDPWRENNIVKIPDSRNATHQLDTPCYFLEKVSLGLFKFQGLRKSDNQQTHTNSVDPALGSLPPMVLSLWKKKYTTALRTAGLC